MTNFPHPINPEALLICALLYLATGEEQHLLLYLTRHLGEYEANFSLFLEQWFGDICDRFPLESQIEIAQALIQLAHIIQNVIKPFNEQRYQICHTCYQLALSKLSQSTHPQDWATLQWYLGKLYRIQPTILADSSEKEAVELAIGAYQNALTYFTREAFPQQWATIQNDLGGVYLKRIQGDRRENLEKAVLCYYNALQIFDQESYAETFAGIQNNLGNFYRERIWGDRAANIEIAIGCCTNALSVLTRERYPADWAGIQMNLGDCYRDRVKGDRAKNLEQAIDCYTAALQIYNTPDLTSQRQLVLTKLEQALTDRRTQQGIVSPLQEVLS